MKATRSENRANARKFPNCYGQSYRLQGRRPKPAVQARGNWIIFSLEVTYTIDLEILNLYIVLLEEEFLCTGHNPAKYA